MEARRRTLSGPGLGAARHTDASAAGRPTVLVLMGVSGCGKSTLGGVLHGRLGWPLCEGDDLHPAANVQKMAQGHPLTDDDRWPWLRTIRAWIDDREAAGESALVTCSALRRSYRDVLRDPQVLFVHLSGSRELLLSRLAGRHGHFMPASLLDSQLATLQPPQPDERSITVDIGEPLSVQSRHILDTLGL